ncbi:hypothetical protein LTR10_006557 [Elasticomyces elasticus]|nr:hypothetical protein LTR10_006557 [Elasticomyces elasticus]KAK4973041.1 hypothetical protein LTR42_006335 [Elasticomyces elasticus]
MSAYDLLTSVVPNFFYSQLFITPKKPTTDCTGKTIIVTGANTGLGKEAARHFVRLGAEKVIIACRNVQKGEAAKKDIASSGASTIIEVWQLDLQDYDSVKAFAKRANSLKRLDIVLENAGINTQNYVSVGGNESTITVNVVSTFLLALLILPKLQETAKVHNITPNLCIVSSDVHFMTQFNERKSPAIFDTLNDPKQANMMGRYPLSKLLEVLACREIAREHPVSDFRATLNFLTPGLCKSELLRDDVPAALRPIVNLFMLLARTTEVGARTLVISATAGPETHGKYFADGKVTRCANLVEGPEGPDVQRRVWAELAEKLEQIEPGVTKVLDA